MPTKLNCWEFMLCGREPGGAKVAELGVCPAAMESVYHKVNNGTNAGRACWFVAGTLCGGDVQGVFLQKIADCFQCEFYWMVKNEENLQ